MKIVQSSTSAAVAAALGTLEQRQATNWPNGPRDVVNLAPDIDARPFAIITADDGYEDIYYYSLEADAYGVKMTAFLHSTWIDKAQGAFVYPFLTSAMLQTMHANGHEIAGHSMNNRDLRAVTYDECLADFKSVNARLEGVIGGDYRCLTMAWPMNLHDAESRSAAEAVYIGARGGFASATLPLPDEMSPAGSHTPHLFAAYMVPKVTTVEDITSDTANDEATIRAAVVTNLQTAINSQSHFILGSHNRAGCTYAQMGYICDEIAADNRFRLGTFAECVRWTRERVPRGNDDQWIASYNRRFFWRSASASTFTLVYTTTGGPRNNPYLRITNTTGAEATYRFVHDTYAGEEMTFSAYVRGVVAGTPTLVAAAVQLRVADTDDASHDAPSTWTRISHTRTPGAGDDVYSGFAIQAGVTIDIAMPQLEVGTLTPWVDPYPYATT
jgi:hypothetical protein